MRLAGQLVAEAGLGGARGGGHRVAGGHPFQHPGRDRDGGGGQQLQQDQLQADAEADGGEAGPQREPGRGVEHPGGRQTGHLAHPARHGGQRAAPQERGDDQGRRPERQRHVRQHHLRAQQVVHGLPGDVGADQLRPHALEVGLHTGAGPRDVGGVAGLQFGGHRTVGPVPELVGLRQRPRTVGLVRLEDRMPGGQVDPQLRVRVVGVVAGAGDRIGTDGLGVDLDQDVGGLCGRRAVVERDHGEVPQGAVVAGARPVVDLVGLVDGGHQGRVEFLDDDGALEPDRQRGRVAPDPPGHRVRPEEPVVVGGGQLRCGGQGGDPVPKSAHDRSFLQSVGFSNTS